MPQVRQHQAGSYQGGQEKGKNTLDFGDPQEKGISYQSQVAGLYVKNVQGIKVMAQVDEEQAADGHGEKIPKTAGGKILESRIERKAYLGITRNLSSGPVSRPW